MKTIQIAAFSGSLRKASYTTSLVRAFAQLAPQGIAVSVVDISGLPFFNEDLENDPPEPVKLLQRHIESADAVLLATPEYNRSYAPALKNALDWGSRPAGKNKWAGKPTGIIGCTPYMLGAFGAQNHLRQVVMYLDMYVLQQPEFYLGKAGEKFTEQGVLTDKETTRLIEKYWEVFSAWIKKTI